MSMFLNYNDISENYVPNNLKCSFPVGKSYTKLDPLQASKPYEEYDSQGNLIGYFWHHGETINLEFNIDGQITVEDDALIFFTAGQEPTTSTTAKIGQRAYNVVDKRSWTCVSFESDNIYVWSEDSTFTYDEGASRNIYVDATDYLKDKFIEFSVYNFRMELIHVEKISAKTKVIFNINKELSKKLVKGVYYCSLTVLDDTICLPIFNSHDCVLLVK